MFIRLKNKSVQIQKNVEEHKDHCHLQKIQEVVPWSLSSSSSTTSSGGRGIHPKII